MERQKEPVVDSGEGALGHLPGIVTQRGVEAAKALKRCGAVCLHGPKLLGPRLCVRIRKGGQGGGGGEEGREGRGGRGGGEGEG